MNSSKTAPEPYNKDGYPVEHGPECFCRKCCEARRCPPATAEQLQKADALRLVRAAAPDLLRALKMYRDILIGAKKPVSPIITDAIAKAEGGAA